MSVYGRETNGWRCVESSTISGSSLTILHTKHCVQVAN